MIYRDPAKDFRKVSDFDVQNWRPGLRELYERSNTASLIAGTILAGHGGGGAFGEVFALVTAALDALSCADEQCCRRILLHFLWNWTGLLGNRGGDLRHCSACACECGDDGVLWFIPGEGFLCKNCMVREYNSQGTGAALGPGARRWLLAVQDRHPAELLRHTPADSPLDITARKELNALITMLEHQ
jgi:DNA repair protein RecO (recombination protein O)